MKEHTYGWYPPARSRWDTSKELTTYHKESLYKHWSSRYNDQPGVPTPQPSTPIRALHATKTSRPTTSRPTTRSFQRPPTQPEQLDLAISGSRAPSVGSHRQVTTPSMKRSPVKARKAWATQVAATPTSIPHYLPVSSTNMAGNGRISIDQMPMMAPPSAHPLSRAASVQGHATSRRSQSATIHRQRATPPARPSRSAGSTRSLPMEERSTKNEDVPLPPTAPSPSLSVEKPCPSVERPGAPQPVSETPEAPWPVDEEAEDEASVGGSLPEEESTDYEEQLEKYGWRFEIPGDPFNLKKPTLPERLPYTVKIPVPKVAPSPPTGHMMNYDTYFLNTIPRKPMSFTIHKEWISEVLHAKRLDLQKKEGTNYNYKEYAFIY